MDSLTKVLPPTPNFLADAMALPRQYPRLAIAISVTALSIPWAIDNYHKYLALGRGGMPYNVLGWLGSTAFKPFGRETLSVAMYSDSDGQSWLDGELVERRGTRPRTGWHFLPHRQVDKIPGKKTCDALDKLFAEVASRNPSLVILTRSPHEGLVQGMVIHQDVPSPHKTADKCWREIGHVHPPDHSLHVVLSPKDCKLVIENGWGERHPLSGVALIPMSREYLLIYAPRNQEELEVVEKIVQAAIGFMTGSKEVL